MNLNRYLSKNKMKPHHFAKQHGFSDSTIWRIYKGKMKPSSRVAMQIIKATDGKVTFNDLMCCID